MIKFKILTLLLICCISNTITAQEVDSTSRKQIEFIKKIYFSVGQDIFKKKEITYRLITDYVAPWNKISKEYTKLLQTCIDTIVANGAISIEQNQFLRTSLIFKSKVEGIDDLRETFQLKLIENTFIDSSKRPILIKQKAHSNFGSTSGSNLKNGKYVSYNYTTVSTSFQVDFQEGSKKKIANASGTAIFEASFPSGYEKILITDSDKGKAFSLGNKKYQVLDIMNNIIVLKLVDPTKEVVFDFDFVNTNSSGQKIAQVPFMELRKMNENKQGDAYISSTSKKTIPKNIYAIFKANPTITKEEFNKLLEPILNKIVTSDDPKVAGKEFLGEKVIVINCAGPINNFYMYIERRETKKTFSKSL